MSAEEKGTKGLQEAAVKGARAAEALRLVAMEQAARVEEARAQALRREQARVAVERPDDPARRERLEARAAAAHHLGSELVAEVAAVRTEPPTVADDAFTVYGRVVDEGRQGLAKRWVGALREDGSLVKDAITGEDGGFELELGGAPSPEELNRSRAESAERSEIKEVPAVLLEVRDAPKGRVRYRDDYPQALTGGRASYRELMIRGARGESPSNSEGATSN